VPRGMKRIATFRKGDVVPSWVACYDSDHVLTFESRCRVYIKNGIHYIFPIKEIVKDGCLVFVKSLNIDSNCTIDFLKANLYCMPKKDRLRKPRVSFNF